GAAIHPTMAPVPLAEAEKQGKEFMENAGYSSITEFRKLPTRDIYEIYNASKRFGFPMVIDGYLLPKSLPEIFESGEQAQVPLLVGWNSAEIPGMAFTQGPITRENFIAKVKEAYPETHKGVLDLYPHNTQEQTEWAATNLASDRFIVYSTWKWFDLHRKNSDQPVYRYLYSKIRPPLRDQNLASGLAGGTVERGSDAPQMPKPIGAPHAAEIEYAMGNLHLVDDYAWTADDFKASATMQNYFANFISTGDPNGENLPEWPNAEAKDTKPPVMIIDIESGARDTEYDARYLFLDKAYGN
ncbi:MAG: carboxylesterase family protein, partial [Pricia sp.]|nr:carboxylesterase family protein [Pricia sp.]